MANVFVSYARRDRQRVAQLTSALESEGLSVWWDSDLAPGGRYRQVIAEQLVIADSVIVIWTAAALESDWVQDEAEEGRQRGVLIPVVFEPVRPPAGFRQVQAADLSQWAGSPQHPEFRSLVFAIRSLVQIAGANGPAAAAPPPGSPVQAGEAGAAPVAEEAGPEAVSVEPAPAAVATPTPTAPESQSTAPQRPSPEVAAPASARPRGAGLVGVLFGWLWWAGVAITMTAAATIISAFDGGRDGELYLLGALSALPLLAALLTLASRRAQVGEGAKTAVAWISVASGALMLLWFFNLMREEPRPVETAFGILFFALLAMSVVFVLAAGVALVVRLLRPPSRASASLR